MITPVRVAAAAVIGVLAIGGAIYLGGSGLSSVAGPGPSHTPTPSASPSASASHAATNYTTLPGWIVFEYAGKAPDGTTPASVDYPQFDLARSRGRHRPARAGSRSPGLGQDQP